MLRTLSNSKGFTLIELVMVIVILGVLAAVAVPKFTDLRHRAYLATEQGVVGGVRSGISVYAVTAIADGRTTTGSITINNLGVPFSLDSTGDAARGLGMATTELPVFNLVLGQGAIRSDWDKTVEATYIYYPGSSTTYWTDHGETDVVHTWYYNNTTIGDGEFTTNKTW